MGNFGKFWQSCLHDCSARARKQSENIYTLTLSTSAASTPLVSSQKTFNVKNMDLNELRNITKDNASAVDFLREKECLRRTPPSCPVCPKNMSLIKDTSYGYIWRCSAHKGKRVAIKKGSFFEKSHIPLTKVSDFNSFWV